MRTWYGILTFIVIGFVSGPSNAGMFFVREGGSDTADGSGPQTAFATVGHAAAVIENPGDQVIVGPGTFYEGNITPGRSGIIGHPVVFIADPTGERTGDPAGPVLIIPPAAQTTGFLVLGRHDIVIDGFTIAGAIDAGIQVRSSADGSANSSSVTIRNTEIRDGKKRGIDVSAAGVVVIENNLTIGNGSAGIAVQGCQFASSLCKAATTEPITPTVSNNIVGSNASTGIFLKGVEAAVVQNNRSFSNGETGLTLRGGTNSLVVNNLIYANATDGIAIGTEDLSAPTLTTPNATILNNTVYANGGWGLIIGSAVAPSPGATVVNNIFQHNLNGGISLARNATCSYVSGFNINVDGYGAGTPVNPYDIIADANFLSPAGADGILGANGYADDDFRLRQRRGGQGITSPAVDAGGATVAATGLAGTTANGNVPDVGVIDIGYHYGARPNQRIVVPTLYMPLFVRANGNDDNDGLDPRRALASIQEAARRARAGATVVVGPGVYAEGDIHPVQNAGRTAFFADDSGMATGDLPDVVLVNAGGKETGFILLSSCSVVVDGFHVTGANTAGIQVRAGSDGARIRNNVVFSNANRGIEVRQADAAEIRNNLVYDNGTGGIRLDTSRNSDVVNNTVYANGFDGILVGSSSDANAATGTSVLRNVVADNAKGIEVKENSLTGYVTGFNVVWGPYSFADVTPRADSDYNATPELVNPFGPDGILGGTGFLDDDFHLAQSTATVSPAVDVDVSDLNALAAGSTRSDGLPDLGPLDAGYHYPFLPHTPEASTVAAVVFVRRSGNDRNAGGSPDAAFASIEKALDAIAGTALVVLGPGSYPANGLTIGDAGTADALPVLLGDATGMLTGDVPGPIVIDSMGHRGPAIAGPAVIDGLRFTAARGAGLRVLRNVRGVTIRNTTLCGNDAGLMTRGDGVNLTNDLVCGNGGTGVNVRLLHARHITRVLNTTVVANRGRGVFVRELAATLSHVMLHNNIVSGNGAVGITARAVHGDPPPTANNLNTDGYGPRTPPGAGDLALSPEFVTPPDPTVGCGSAENYRVDTTSTAINNGVGTAVEIGLGERSVVVTGTPDSGPVDLGFHY